MKMAFGAYHAAWSIATPFLRRNKRLANGYNERVLVNAAPTPVDIWFHAASTGEAYLAADLARSMLQIKPYSILFTTQTEQGRLILKQVAATRGDVDFQFRYLPLDIPPLMNRFVQTVNPKAAVLIETELWPAMLRALKKNGSKVMIANGRITERSFRRLKWVSSIWRRLAPDLLLATSGDDAERFAALFDCPVQVVSNIKFDQLEIQPTMSKISKADLCSKEAPLVVLGSVRTQEAQAVEKIIRGLLAEKPDLTFALFPKHVHRLGVWETLLDEIKLPFQYRSQMKTPAASGSVILGDTIGELKMIYGLADAVFVGGSLAPLGGQNFLEPLLYGRRPVIGPFWDNFKWVGPSLFDQGFVQMADSPKAAADAILQVLKQSDHQQCQEAVQRYLAVKQGGTEGTVKALKTLLSSE